MSLADVLLSGDDTSGARLVYGVATATNTVTVAGSEVAVTMPALSPVVSGDYCAILAAGADRLILGPVSPYPIRLQVGDITVPSSGAATATATVTFSTPFTSPPIFVCNLRGSGGFFVVTAGTTTATQAPLFVFRTDGANVTVDRTVHWMAVGAV